MIGPELAGQEVEVRVTDRVADFVAFYDAVRQAEEEVRAEEEARAEADAFDPPVTEDLERSPPPSEADRRWALWLELYAFPPPPENAEARGEARRRLEQAWPRYGALVEQLRPTAGRMEPAPAPVLREVGRVLRLDRSLKVHLVAYVGTFDRGPSLEVRSDELRVLFPVEHLPGGARVSLIRVFAEAVQARLSGRSPEHFPTLAESLLARGIALRVHEALSPDLPAERYLPGSLGWLLEAERRDARILAGIRPALDDRREATLARFTTGRGATGHPRELDYAAWRLVGHLILLHGWTLERLARVPAAEVPDLVAEAVDEALARAR